MTLFTDERKQKIGKVCSVSYWFAIGFVLLSIIFNVQISSFMWNMDLTDGIKKKKEEQQKQTTIKLFLKDTELSKQLIETLDQLRTKRLEEDEQILSLLREQFKMQKWMIANIVYVGDKESSSKLVYDAAHKWTQDVDEWKKIKTFKKAKEFYRETFLKTTHKDFTEALENAFLDEIFGVYRNFPQDATKLMSKFIDQKMLFWQKCESHGGPEWKKRSEKILSDFRKFKTEEYKQEFLEAIHNKRMAAKNQSEDKDEKESNPALRFFAWTKEELKKYRFFLTLFSVNFSDEELNAMVEDEKVRFDRLAKSIDLNRISSFETTLKNWNSLNTSLKEQFFNDFGTFLKKFQNDREAIYKEAKKAMFIAVKGKDTDKKDGAESLFVVKFLRPLRDGWKYTQLYFPFRILLPRYETLKNGKKDFLESGWDTHPTFSGSFGRSIFGFLVQLVIFLAMQLLVFLFLVWRINKIDTWQSAYPNRKRNGFGVKMAKRINENWTTFQSCYFKFWMLAFNFAIFLFIYFYDYHN